MKLKQNSLKTVFKLFKNCFVSAKTAVKRFSCFSQSQPVSAVYAKLLSMMLMSYKLDSASSRIL